MAQHRTIWMVRHGNRRDFADPAWLHTADRPHDPPLASDGLVQADEVGIHLQSHSIDHIIASPYLRAAQTADGIARRLSRPVKIEPGLCEVLYENWYPDRHDWMSAAALHPRCDSIDTSYQPLVIPRYPEDAAAMFDRARAVTGRLLDHLDGNLLLVTHGGAISFMVRALLPSTPSVQTPMCCLIRLDLIDGLWSLTHDGSDTSHLSATESTVRLH